MTILLLMIPLSLLFVGVAVATFFWAVNHDQFDDMDSPGLMPLSDDTPVAAPVSESADKSDSCHSPDQDSESGDCP